MVEPPPPPPPPVFHVLIMVVGLVVEVVPLPIEMLMVPVACAHRLGIDSPERAMGKAIETSSRGGRKREGFKGFGYHSYDCMLCSWMIS